MLYDYVKRATHYDDSSPCAGPPATSFPRRPPPPPSPAGFRHLLPPPAAATSPRRRPPAAASRHRLSPPVNIGASHHRRSPGSFGTHRPPNSPTAQPLGAPLTPQSEVIPAICLRTVHVCCAWTVVQPQAEGHVERLESRAAAAARGRGASELAPCEAVDYKPLVIHVHWEGAIGLPNAQHSLELAELTPCSHLHPTALTGCEYTPHRCMLSPAHGVVRTRIAWVCFLCCGGDRGNTH